MTELGKLSLSLRSLAGAATAEPRRRRERLTWDTDVSPALRPGKSAALDHGGDSRRQDRDDQHRAGSRLMSLRLGPERPGDRGWPRWLRLSAWRRF